ncbi:MAG: P-type conjugative transfer protein TrbL [Tatlockia sp.]|nr:P-type conjugative transfer protein TrbL [Tatlockia sp.]
MKKGLASAALCILLSLLVSDADAASFGINNADILDSILSRFQTTASGWGNKLVDFGSWLFWGLALISMVWTYGFMLLKKADFGEFFGETIRFFATTGFFWWILKNGPAIATSIMDTCRKMASDASGLSQVVSPSGIIDIGFDIAYKVVDQSSIWSPAASTAGVFIAVFILIALTLVSVNLLIIFIAGWFLAYGGVFLLGFGGGRWTQDIAINYYKAVLGVGMEMFAMILIVGIGKSFIDQYYAAMGPDMAFKELLIMLVVSIILLHLVNKIPSKLASIVGGGGASGGGLGSFGMGAALAAAAGAGAVVASAAAGVMGAGASMAGGASALKAAFQAAQSSMSQNASSEGSSGKGSGGGGLSSAMGGAARFVSELGSQLAKGASQTVKDSFNSMKENAQSRIADTVGGKIAEAINSNQGGSGGGESTSQKSTPDSLQENSLGPGQMNSSGSNSSSSNDEVANFVNKACTSESDKGGE